MRLYENRLYQDDLKYICTLDLPWEELHNSSVIISGARGLIGSCLTDALVYMDLNEGLNCQIYAIGRDRGLAKSRFEYCWDNDCFHFIAGDCNKPIEVSDISNIGYVIHLASNTHPVAYSIDPIGTITTNITGTFNMLNLAVKYHAKRFVFASSNEIYGENRGDRELFDESYCGYLDPNTLRAGYPESKRCGEALCEAYRSQEGLDIVIPRFTRSYGPTMLMSDTKAISQFIKNALSDEDIVLKSAGKQFYSYTYVADAVAGLFTVLLKGNDGEAYNIADESGDIILKDLAEYLAQKAGRKVICEVPDEQEKKGYSLVTKARLNGGKLKSLGWNARYSIKDGLDRTLSILHDIS